VLPTILRKGHEIPWTPPVDLGVARMGDDVVTEVDLSTFHLVMLAVVVVVVFFPFASGFRLLWKQLCISKGGIYICD